MVPGEHARGVSRAQHQAPYDRQDAGRSGGGRDMLMDPQEAQHQMQGVLADKAHNHIEVSKVGAWQPGLCGCWAPEKGWSWSI